MSLEGALVAEVHGDVGGGTVYPQEAVHSTDICGRDMVLNRNLSYVYHPGFYLFLPPFKDQGKQLGALSSSPVLEDRYHPNRGLEKLKVRRSFPDL